MNYEVKFLDDYWWNGKLYLIFAGSCGLTPPTMLSPTQNFHVIYTNELGILIRRWGQNFLKFWKIPNVLVPGIDCFYVIDDSFKSRPSHTSCMKIYKKVIYIKLEDNLTGDFNSLNFFLNLILQYYQLYYV